MEYDWFLEVWRTDKTCRGSRGHLWHRANAAAESQVVQRVESHRACLRSTGNPFHRYPSTLEPFSPFSPLLEFRASGTGTRFAAWIASHFQVSRPSRCAKPRGPRQVSGATVTSGAAPPIRRRTVPETPRLVDGLTRFSSASFRSSQSCGFSWEPAALSCARGARHASGRNSHRHLPHRASAVLVGLVPRPRFPTADSGSASGESTPPVPARSRRGSEPTTRPDLTGYHPEPPPNLSSSLSSGTAARAISSFPPTDPKPWPANT